MKNGTIICRVEITNVGLVMEKRLSVTDDVGASAASCFYCYTMLPVVLLLVCIITVAVVPLWMIEELQCSLIYYYRRKVRAWRYRRETERLLYEYGDLSPITELSGASEMTARINNLLINEVLVTGVEASNILAEQDLKAMSKYKDKIIQLGQKHNINAALIAAIISKQSRAGTILEPSGYGQFDKNSYGLMQINKTLHAVTGYPFSLEHIDDGTKYLIHQIKCVRESEEFRNWSSRQKLIGALVAYISGPEKLKEVLEFPDDADRVTPTGDFANDVIARAKWFANHGY
ncbi:lysozyme g-like [Leuresthes tenuis]|uniref:lysozyme g-like n=1 Tax=Leuresthes tenuis TaxID=355514 RepID=UPI003B50A75C